MDQEQITILIMYGVLVLLFVLRTIWEVIKYIRAPHQQRVRLLITQGIQLALILTVIIITGMNLIRLGP